MHLNLFTLCLGLSLALASVAHVSAQETNRPDTLLYTVETKDGNAFYGTLVSENEEVVVLKTEYFGELTIRREIIRFIRPLAHQKMVNGRPWFDNPYSGRYLAGTSAYGLRQGEGSVDNGWLLFNQVSYGLSDHFSLGAGFAPLLIFDGPFPLWVTPKLSIPLKKDKLSLAVAGLFGRSFSDYEEDDARFGAVYSQLTIGSPDANLTLGYGYGFADGDWSNKPLFSINGILRTGPRFALLGESVIVPADFDSDAFSLVGTGVRFMGRHFAIDLAMLLMVIPDDGAYPLPWISMHIPFGRAKY